MGESIRTLPRQSAFWMYLGLVAILLLVTLLLWRTYTGDDAQPVAMDVDEAVAEALASMAETSDPAISALVYRSFCRPLSSCRPTWKTRKTDFASARRGRQCRCHGAHVAAYRRWSVGGPDCLCDGSESPAIVTGVDPERDIAVLTPTSLPGLIVPATLGSSSGLRVGTRCLR